MPVRKPTLDCMQCGACCANPNKNREVGFVDYIEVKKEDTLRKKAELMRRFVVYNELGEAHMRLDPHGRCVALRGRIGREVYCSVYAHRPSGCRRVDPGSRGCLQARTDRGVDETGHTP